MALFKINNVPYSVISIAGDGNCLFSSLAYLIYGTIDRGMEVRIEIVEHVVRNWNRFQVLTSTVGGDNYTSPESYFLDMRKREMYGTTCELQAAGEIYLYRFEVWRNGVIYCAFGSEHHPVKRLRFSGELCGGHFDVLEPTLLASQISENTPPGAVKNCFKKRKSRRTILQNKKGRRTILLSQETFEDRIRRLNSDKERQKLRISRESKEDKDTRLSDKRKRIELRRSQENEEEKKKRLLETKEGMATLRSKRKNTCQGIKIGKQNVITNDIEERFSEHYCGPMNLICSFCSAKHFSGELPQDKMFSDCCQKGKVDLTFQNSEPYPGILHELLTGKHSESKNFMANIRSFNSAFSFASMGAQVKAPPGFGPYCFRIHGQIYHKATTLHPAPGERRKYAQLYILDPDEATNRRMNIAGNTNCNSSIMYTLGQFMSKHNQLAKAYKMLYEVEMEAENEARQKGIAPYSISMAIKYDRSMDKNRYNVPRANEVAVIFQNIDGEPPFERDLLIHLRPDLNNSKTITNRISILHPSLEPMTYPLLFPFGESGWHPEIRICVNDTSNKRQRVSQMAYYSYRISVRKYFNQFLSAGKLTQQYLVDSYVKMEANRLKWIRDHQKELRAESYQGLMDFLHSKAAQEGLSVGKLVILPSTFIGSARNMQQNYQDAMAIVRKFGKPDLFITMTCNPKWREITENMEPYQTDRPDLIARVFALKLNELLSDICKMHIFGKVIAKIHVIEFQKRGLPHCHMLIILADDDKIRDRDDIDTIVSAEIPDPIESPQLHKIVLRHMVHGPCGTVNPSSPCMVDGKCSKEYPKPFQQETVSNSDGYPKYRRRDTLATYKTAAGLEVSNRWIVPYNPYLSLKYNCHINVEVCASVKSVKYLFKYVYKGHDCANVEIKEHGILSHDEISTYVDARYVSAPEAAWRIFAKPMHHQTHTIVRLAVHLPNQQTLYFRPDTAQEAVNNVSLTGSTLTAWFLLNESTPNARRIYYQDIPEKYVYNKKNWLARAKTRWK